MHSTFIGFEIFLYYLPIDRNKTSATWQYSPCQVELGINAQGWENVAEADGKCS
jgi:hypothetical protein